MSTQEQETRLRRASASLWGLFRSERQAAVVLLLAAVAGLICANSAAAPWILGIHDSTLATPALHLELTVGEWVSDLVLAIFFFVVAVELKSEFRVGSLNTVRKALVPAVAAAGGVIAPAVVFLIVAGPANAQGWPVPTATDIAFAVGLLATFGRFLPPQLRVFLLALAVIDDLIGIALIALLFAGGLDVLWLILAVVGAVAFATLARATRMPKPLKNIALVLIALAFWYAIYRSGIHPTVAGVVIGLLMPLPAGEKAAYALAPWSAWAVLPLFAFSASLVVIPAPEALGPVFVGLAVALPVGKAIGIFVGGLVGARIARGQLKEPIVGWDLFALAVTGGVGFTVALLMGQLAFRNAPALIDQAVLGVLLGSLVSIICGSLLISWRSRVHRRRSIVESAPVVTATTI